MGDGRRESKAHGSAGFPMDVYFLEQDGGDYTKLFCHWHEECEIILVTEGGGSFQVGGRSCRVLAGEAVFVLPGRLHAAVALEGMPCRYVSAVFHPSLLAGGEAGRPGLWRKYVAPVLEGELVFPIHITGDTETGRQLLKELYDIRALFRERRGGCELLAKAAVLRVWYLLWSRAEKNAEAGHMQNERNLARVKAALDYMHSRYREDIALDELARAARMSRGQFCRVFRSLVGETPVQYLNGYRIRCSAGLLEETDRKISDVASSVGYSSIGYYNRMFRRYMGCTPSEYRKRRWDN
mgnify:CR=1 FL=1